jgi:predicted amidohydrolase YtcJ
MAWNTDIGLVNARVLTMDGRGTEARAIAVRGDRVRCVGSADAVAAALPDGAPVIDLGGRTVVPGLIDAHTHLELTAYARHFWEDVRDRDVPAILAHIRELAACRPAGEWIVLQGTFGQRFPDRAALDAAAPDHPVAVRWTMHKCQLNGCALAISGIDERTIAPPGARIHRGPDGRLTGLVEEGWDLLDWRPPLLAPLREALAETATNLFLRHGITTICEIGASATGVSAYQQLAAEGALPVRIGLALTASPGHQPLATIEDLRGLGIRSGFGGPDLSILALKIFADGGRDGAFRSTDLDRPAAEWGLLTRVPQRLAYEVGQAFAAGVQPWIHAIGDLAQEIAVSAIEQGHAAYGDIDHRARIEHFGNELYAPETLRRLLEAGGVPVPNPSFVHAEPDDPEQRLPDADTLKYGLRTLKGAGATILGNSDTAGAQPFACNPWFTISCMVRRRNKNNVVIAAEEALSVEEALRAYTADAAWGIFAEGSRGTLEPGKHADLAVLSEDPLRIDPSRLAGVTSVLTMVGGVVRHSELDLPAALREGLAGAPAPAGPPPPAADDGDEGGAGHGHGHGHGACGCHG